MGRTYPKEYVEFFLKHYPNMQTDKFIALAKEKFSELFKSRDLTRDQTHHMAHRHGIKKAPETKRTAREPRRRIVRTPVKTTATTAPLVVADDIKKVEEPPKITGLKHENTWYPTELLEKIVRMVSEKDVTLAHAIRKISEEGKLELTYSSVMSLFLNKIKIRVADLHVKGKDYGVQRVNEYVRKRECKILHEADWRASDIQRKVNEDFPELPKISLEQIKHFTRGHRLDGGMRSRKTPAVHKRNSKKPEILAADEVYVTLEGRLSYKGVISMEQAIEVIKQIEQKK